MGCLAIAVLLTLGCARTPEVVIIAEPDPLPTGWVEPMWDGDGTYLYSEVPDGYANLTLSCWLPNRPVGVVIGSGPGDRFDYRDRTAQVWLEWDGQSADGYGGKCKTPSLGLASYEPCGNRSDMCAIQLRL